MDNKEKETITEVITQETETIDTSKEETYTITYNISYKDFSKSLTRKIVIKKDKAD